MARALNPRRCVGSKMEECSSSPKGNLVESLSVILTIALECRDRKALLLCKAVTDACFVNLTWLYSGGEGDCAYLFHALRQTWRIMIEGEKDDDDLLSSADLHLIGSWFRGWWATDGGRGHGEQVFVVGEMLPGNWIWVLDHLEILGTPEGRSFEEELELDLEDERLKGVKKETWGLEELVSALLESSDDKWFQGKKGITLDLQVDGPTRATTFRRVLSRVPGAIYGCLEDGMGEGFVPPTFRIYTMGDIGEALGPAMVRRRALERLGGPGRSTPYAYLGHRKEARVSGCKRWGFRGGAAVQVASLTELQVTWAGGRTHLLGWVDCQDILEEVDNLVQGNTGATRRPWEASRGQKGDDDVV
ncbi:unnamed protein product [Choristocarpus tenellus]